MKKSGRIEVIARGVFVRQGRILLCHSKGAPNTYLPGGHVEFGESAPVALARELKEELGAEARVKRFLGCVENVFVQKGKLHCEINLVFEVGLTGLGRGARPCSCEDYIEFLWRPLSRLSGSKIEPAILRRLIVPWLKSPKGGAGWASTYPAR